VHRIFSNTLRREFNDMAPASVLLDRWGEQFLLGTTQAARSVEFCARNCIAGRISCTIPSSEPMNPEVHDLAVDMSTILDWGHDHFHVVVRFCEKIMSERTGNVMIHCHSGSRRGGLLAVVVHSALTGANWESSWDFVHAIRPTLERIPELEDQLAIWSSMSSRMVPKQPLPPRCFPDELHTLEWKDLQATWRRSNISEQGGF
jgi:hypothetical protein